MEDVGHRMIHSESKIYENLRYDSSSKECSQGQVFLRLPKPNFNRKRFNGQCIRKKRNAIE